MTVLGQEPRPTGVTTVTDQQISERAANWAFLVILGVLPILTFLACVK